MHGRIDDDPSMHDVPLRSPERDAEVLAQLDDLGIGFGQPAYLDRKGPHIPGTDLYDGEDGSIEDDDDESYPLCPACGSPIDYCQGHGEIGDPLGADILKLHDLGQHQDCHPVGCDYLRELAQTP